MALPNDVHAIAKSTLFPAALIPEFVLGVKGKSSLAKMSGAKPLSFNGNTLFTFTMDNEVNVVAEAGAKAAGGGVVATKTIVPVKIEYGMRVSDEFLCAAEDEKLEYLKAFSDGFQAKVARGLDIMAFHGVNPRTGSASAVIGTNNFDSALAGSGVIDYLDSGSTADENIEAAIALVQAADNDVTGMIGGKTIKAALAALEDGNDRPLYPALKWGANPGEINGLPVDFNSTVEYNSDDARAYVGDFANCFRWGIAKEIPLEVIRYGCPDNDGTAGDLAGHNQVYIRGEVYIGWAILDATAFAMIEA